MHINYIIKLRRNALVHKQSLDGPTTLIGKKIIMPQIQRKILSKYYESTVKVRGDWKEKIRIKNNISFKD